MKTARHFNSSCPDCNRWKCICNAMQCPDCGEWGEGACACIRREDGFPPYPPAREVQAGAPRSAPAWGRPAARTAPPDSDTRARLAKLRAEIAAHLGQKLRSIEERHCGNCADGVPGGTDECVKCGRAQQYSHWTAAKTFAQGQGD